MPQYTSTLLLAFILVSCFYKSHIKNWPWFKAGLVGYIGSVVASIGTSYLRGTPAYSVGVVVTDLALLGSGVLLIAACLKDARLDVEHIRCLKCGYILKGLSEPRCPECGQAI